MKGFGINGINSIVVLMIVNGDFLYTCGSFTEAGGEHVTHIACWEAQNWCALATNFINIRLLFH